MPHPMATRPPGSGLPATLADWVSRVKKGSGTGRRNRITPIDHLPSERAWATKIKALPSCLRRRRGPRRNTTSHAACHGVMPRALAVVSDVIVIEELSGGMRTAVIY